MNLVSRIACLVALLVSSPLECAMADWIEPIEIVAGKFGSGKGEIGMAKNAAGEPGARIDEVLADGTVVVTDLSNKKTLLFAKSGKLIKEGQPRSTAGAGDRSESSVTEALSVKSAKLENGKYQITATFTDKVYVLESQYEFHRFVKDARGNYYGISTDCVWRLGSGDKATVELILPSPREELLPASHMQNIRRRTAVYVEYGSPVIAPNGDVYLWKMSDIGFGILRFPWTE